MDDAYAGKETCKGGGKMTIKLSEECINELISIGNTDSFENLSKFVVKFPEYRSGQLMRQLPQFWYLIAETLTDEEIISLIKSLTIAEKVISGWKAGSVAPVVWLFRKLRERTKSDQKELSGWIIQHTENIYLPYG